LLRRNCRGGLWPPLGAHRAPLQSPPQSWQFRDDFKFRYGL